MKIQGQGASLVRWSITALIFLVAGYMQYGLWHDIAGVALGGLMAGAVLLVTRWKNHHQREATSDSVDA